ncbi:protein farnesyltransferase subunit beta-like [Ruditapes philippinarum]|uniref:protein farnesyltransferase subunit beta-like n=1 Tax=Ruditapes philippinarum TaxID=129788 RepID=UPI00295B3746|nr:protein farnesyltransferase subunit beta-like [Ruditapes philippinarum]
MELHNFRCCDTNFEKNNINNDDGISTSSSQDQVDVEESVKKLFTNFKHRLEVDTECILPVLHRDEHVAFLRKGLSNLSSSYECLDASRPWLCYWILHALELLDEPLNDETISQVAQFLGKCQCPDGGFAGGPGQQAHLAPTYAAVNALCILGTEESFKVIDRETLYDFLMRMRTAHGSFKMHLGGEEDIRGAYCAASVARLTNIITPQLFDGTPEWIVRCQTYEGGFAGCPGMEAHGGYSFCGIAALTLLNKTNLCDIKNLLRWTVNRQMRYEGGFQGRTNKLVDGCYSFWQGGAFPLIHMVLSMQDDSALSAEHWLFNQKALQEYILVCCQYPGGGLIDKPGRMRDYYHTSYCLSGLSVAQHFAGGKLSHVYNIGHENNILRTTHPVYNVCVEKIVHADLYFRQLTHPKHTENCTDK